MFNVPRLDKRLKNKAEVFGLLSKKFDQPLAIHSKFLKQNKLHTNKIADANLVILTDNSGAHRAYESKEIVFRTYDGQNSVTDSNGNKWKLMEDSLESKDGRKLKRYPSHNVFWFAWYSMFPDTVLRK